VQKRKKKPRKTQKRKEILDLVISVQVAAGLGVFKSSGQKGEGAPEKKVKKSLEKKKRGNNHWARGKTI